MACGSPVASSLTSFAKTERLYPAGHRDMLVAGTVGGERQRFGIIHAVDGKQAASSPDLLSRSDPQLSVVSA
jgi:hypothetical protein